MDDGVTQCGFTLNGDATCHMRKKLINIVIRKYKGSFLLTFISC